MQRSYSDYIKIILAFSMTPIGSLGTMPYGFRFAQGLSSYNHQLAMIIGVILAIAATAKIENIHLVTRDQKLIAYSDKNFIKIIKA